MTKLFIGGLPPHTTEEDVVSMTSLYGSMQSITLIKRKDSGKCRVFCFIEMASETQAQAVIAELNGQQYKGRTLTVKLSEERIVQPNPKVYVKVASGPKKKRPRIKAK